MTDYYHAIRPPQHDARLMAHRRLLADILADAVMVATGKRKPLNRGWDSPERAMTFLHSPCARLWADLLGLDWARMLARIDTTNR